MKDVQIKENVSLLSVNQNLKKGAGNLTLRKAVDAPAFTNKLILSLKFVQKEQMDALKSVQNFKLFRETKKSKFPRGYPWMLKP